MMDLSKFNIADYDLSIFPPSLLGRLTFKLDTAPSKEPLKPGHHLLEIAPERDTILYVPKVLEENKPVPLLVMFHGANGSAEKVLPFLEEQAEKNGFLLLVPQSTLHTWDLTLAGHGPDLHNLNNALNEVATHYQIDPERFGFAGFAGFSDGASYALSTGLTNGNLVSHVIVFSGGFMSVYVPEGKPLVFIAHSPEDRQLPIATSGLKHANTLKKTGYDVEYLEFHGGHIIDPNIVEQGIAFFLNRSK